VDHLLVKDGGSVRTHWQDKQEKAELYIVSDAGNIRTIRLLLDKGARVDMQDNDHSTLLHFALSHRHIDVAKLLLKCGANVHAQNSMGNTALHFASGSGISRLCSYYWTKVQSWTCRITITQLRCPSRYPTGICMTRSYKLLLEH
jgi:ankyrin repeat protein